MSAVEVRKAVSSALLNGDEWPPSLPEFVSLGQSIEIDFDEAFKRMIRGKPQGDIEYWATQEVGFECRRYLTQERARSRYRQALKKYSDKAKSGSLPIRNLMQIADKSNLVPVEKLDRPDPAQFNQNSVFARIAALGKKA
ncbi:Uncharacterised protein [Vibrio cholerae]|uniref:Uncharacterized protein n=1 Tax=Vibrio cholerae TaxID=666 RepID=A0A655US39_VIBCL|nr:hypothetical protein [Vibrio cholerae]EIF2256604.1 hypothetical protein [Vibrio cholerae]EJL6616050.1 hypothetical protein [Vibrio cholerae]EJL6649096.1 hypothetical protein [Vibrio cholerae]EKF9166422.1 hypothetical protein [Vibrio cholerae]CSB55483.1 Uncharacterised protein [Vibrio cholerae]